MIGKAPDYFLRAVKFTGENHWNVNLIRREKSGVESGMMFGQLIDEALAELETAAVFTVKRIEDSDTLLPGTALKNVKNCVLVPDQKGLFQ